MQREDGSDMLAFCPVTKLEIAQGFSKTIQVHTEPTCGPCSGFGCPVCFGRGRVPRVVPWRVTVYAGNPFTWTSRLPYRGEGQGGVGGGANGDLYVELIPPGPHPLPQQGWDVNRMQWTTRQALRAGYTADLSGLWPAICPECWGYGCPVCDPVIIWPQGYTSVNASDYWLDLAPIESHDDIVTLELPGKGAPGRFGGLPGNLLLHFAI